MLTGGHEHNQTWIDAVRAPVQQQQGSAGCQEAEAETEEQVCSAAGSQQRNVSLVLGHTVLVGFVVAATI